MMSYLATLLCSFALLALRCSKSDTQLKQLESELLYCLKIEKGGAKLHAPDSETHYKEILKRTEKYRGHPIHSVQQFHGPWVENLWISNFLSKPLSYFNGMVPLFVQWVDIHAHSFLGPPDRQRFYNPLYEALTNDLASILRPDVIYVTVSQDDEGISRKTNDGLLHRCPNILTLSAGGFGHIPIPLVKGELQYVPYTQSKWPVGFYGNRRSNHTRSLLLTEMESNLKRLQIHYNTMWHDGMWLQNMQQTLFNLAPRGYGRTSYRLTEVIQTGRIPVYLYNDEPWFPYRGSNISIEQIGIHAKLGDSMAAAAARIKLLLGDKNETARMLERVHAARPHYTLSGVIRQVELFFQDPLGLNGRGGYLRCQRTPKAVL